MKRNIIPKGKKAIVFTLVITAVFGLATLSFAGRGQGHGYGNHGLGCGYQMNMSDEDYKAMQEQRAAFLEKTADTRREMMKNQALMQAELASETPDVKRMKEIQKEISALRAKMDEARLTHMLEMRKTNPGFAGFCPYGMGRGMGHGMGHGMGYGMGRGMGCGMSR